MYENSTNYITVRLVYLWVILILLGSIVLETFMIYPNIFRDPPASFAVALEFMAVRTPHDFFPPLGFLSWVSGVGSLILGWRVKSARYWIIGSLLMVVGEGICSMLLFWPRNTIMFIQAPPFIRLNFCARLRKNLSSCIGCALRSMP